MTAQRTGELAPPVRKQARAKALLASANHTLRVGILALPHALASSITSPMDAFRIANALQQNANRELYPQSATASKKGPIELRIVNLSEQDSVLCVGQIQLTDLAADPQLSPLALARQLHYLIVPGLGFYHPEEMLARLKAMTSAHDLLRVAHAAGVRICGSCSGTLLIAASGLLDGGKATTSWWLAPIFQRTFPQIQLVEHAMLVQSDQVITAGATTAMFHLVLHIIEQHFGAALATRCARMLLVDQERVSQAPYVQQAMIYKTRSPFSEKVERYLHAQLARADLTVEQIAEHCAMSTRSLIRHFQQSFHRSPQAYLQQLRIERAKHLLEHSALNLPEILEQIGYLDLASFRKLFRRLTNLTPAAYRAKFAAKVGSESN